MRQLDIFLSKNHDIYVDRFRWVGWIKRVEGFLVPDQEQSLRNFEVASFSNNGKYFAFSTGWMRSLFVVDNKGKQIAEVKFSDLKKLDPNSVDGSIVGWTSDSKTTWFETNMDAFTSSYGRISVLNGQFDLIKRPRNFKSYQIAIDFDSGNTIYSDYPFQFDTESAAQTKKSGKVFTLYKNNLLSPREVSLDVNFGEGFSIQKGKDNSLQYRKSEKEKFTIVKFQDARESQVLLNKICKLTTNLRLRKSPEISASVTMTMQSGSIVKVVEVGTNTTIDGIDGNWVKVETADGAKDRENKEVSAGTIGWCFSGYLD